MIATGKILKPQKNKIATFIWFIGEQGSVIYNTLFPKMVRKAQCWAINSIKFRKIHLGMDWGMCWFSVHRFRFSDIEKK